VQTYFHTGNWSKHHRSYVELYAPQAQSEAEPSCALRCASAPTEVPYGTKFGRVNNILLDIATTFPPVRRRRSGQGSCELPWIFKLDLGIQQF